MKRSRISPISDKRRADAERRRQVREAVFARDGGCLAADVPAWGPCYGEPFTFHHLQKAGQCGPYTEENGVTLCEFHNGMVENDPPTAVALGLVVSGHQKIRGCA